MGAVAHEEIQNKRPCTVAIVALNERRSSMAHDNSRLHLSNAAGQEHNPSTINTESKLLFEIGSGRSGMNPDD
jgi:hypothetical protein